MFNHNSTLPAPNSTHNIHDFVRTYAGRMFASPTLDAIPHVERTLAAYSISYTQTYIDGIVVCAEDLPTIMDAFDLSSIELSLGEEIYDVQLVREELAGVRDFSDNGIYADAMFEMLHHADCYRDSIANIYATDYLDSDDLSPVHAMRNGFPDLGI